MRAPVAQVRSTRWYDGGSALPADRGSKTIGLRAIRRCFPTALSASTSEAAFEQSLRRWRSPPAPGATPAARGKLLMSCRALWLPKQGWPLPSPQPQASSGPRGRCSTGSSYGLARRTGEKNSLPEREHLDSLAHPASQTAGFVSSELLRPFTQSFCDQLISHRACRARACAIALSAGGRRS